MLAALLLAALAAPPEFNYDEAEVPDYTLPDVLGEANSPEDWPGRRAEIVRLFEQHVYGVAPPAPEKVTFEETEEAGPGGAWWRQVRAECDLGDGKESSFPFRIAVPNGTTKENPAPVVVLIVHPARMNQLGDDLSDSDFFPSEAITAAGFAAVALPAAELAPDDKETFDTKLLAALGWDRASNGGDRPADGCGALAAWGWGASRVIDYAAQSEYLDASRVAVVGHSRGGKAAWWAAARDPRFSIAYSNNSGCGGAALSRRRFGETVARINSSFPHWFCPQFDAYNGNEDALPIDQHMLAAAVAPRAVYVASAAEDRWADPRGEFLSLVEANPAFELFGDRKLTEDESPAAGEQVVTDRRGYHLREGGHGLERSDWMQFLSFAAGVWEEK
ncbi:glucuronyl esterase domain-containing protein [Alienimonas californiensis]|uniref:Alpha/beta hydrolase family protein n=1 Tax=Alienimonas californiensis TaxID=2527989 RepID=A0A517PC72_9PLAN|nr:prolyl oligopeptidase family serine peptidase [Alienimonas californiensis]QDT16969.1 Alpha/beta hydrolase family protein [Alienimonas californiensis]